MWLGEDYHKLTSLKIRLNYNINFVYNFLGCYYFLFPFHRSHAQARPRPKTPWPGDTYTNMAEKTFFSFFSSTHNKHTRNRPQPSHIHAIWLGGVDEYSLRVGHPGFQLMYSSIHCIAHARADYTCAMYNAMSLKSKHEIRDSHK